MLRRIINKLFSGNQNETQIQQTYSYSDLLTVFSIPEPTKSLVFVSHKPIDKIESPLQMKVELSLDEMGRFEVNTVKPNDWYQEPSLIWTKLPIKKNSKLEERTIYYPTYSQLSPENRYQYLQWLTDITKETNLSYVFLYYYGLERHLLVGDYDAAVDEILRLLKFHDKGSLRSYASSALIASSVYRERPDILERAPFVLDDVDDLGLLFRFQLSRGISAKDIIQIASQVGFVNRRYIKLLPERFLVELQKVIFEYESNHGKILDSIKWDDLKKEEGLFFANISVPKQARHARVPQVIRDKEFSRLCRELLEVAHKNLKDQLKLERTKN